MIRELKNGSEEAFVKLMEVYGNKLLGTCYLILKDRQEAEDVVQETFVKVYKNIRGFREDSGLYTWIYKIALNLSRDKLRKRTFNLSLHEEIPGEDDVELEIETSIDKESLREGIKTLEPIYRESLVLFYYQELSIREIASITGEKEGTVKSRLSRARKHLKGQLQKGGIGSEK